MSAGPVTPTKFQDLFGAHNNLTGAFNDLKSKHDLLTRDHDDLKTKHNLAVNAINGQGQRIRLLEETSEAEALRVTAVVQSQNALTLRQDAQQRILERLNGLVERLEASERAQAAWLDEKQELTDRINKLEENSTAVTAISSQVNSLMERLATQEQAHATLIEQKKLYAQRLTLAEETIDLQSQIIEDLSRKDDIRNSLDNDLREMRSQVSAIYQAIMSDAAPSSSQITPSSPAPAAADRSLSVSSSPAGSPIRNPQSPIQQKLARLRTLAQQRSQLEIVEQPEQLALAAPLSSALVQPPATNGTSGC